MSELVNSQGGRFNMRWKLLAGASTLALMSYVSSARMASAEDADRPAVWIELGGQFDFVNDATQTWLPRNVPPPIDHPVTGILSQKPKIGYDVYGKLTFQPTITDWTFSAAIRYGRATRGPKFAHDQTYKTHRSAFGQKYVPTTYAFTDMHSRSESRHFILDFQAGKDVGLGIFGKHENSVLNFGIRVAQFREQADSSMSAQISVPAKYAGAYYEGKLLDAYMHSTRSFTGIGPSIAWSGSLPLAGSSDDGLALDWDANAALLFGRQKATVRTHTDKIGFNGVTYEPYEHLLTTIVTHATPTAIRKKTVIVPNVGGFAGISYRLGGRGKVSVGYRADFFFGAMDGGIDARKTYDRNFHGPFARISIGLGG